ncbi:contractile injection system protein, VgrG/Pvc8 family [uncultured Sphingomonas sp.]|uniref:contractile injection system protein, VgrG/Pvc8 family n=1 Tax=uncultured Sphingomonas sp. TaxID=158754 RepID=UPI0025EE1086|nr:contractile injection system protein, VgrG/Pvc8 family [uncultured Sphingomonas sp.]
MSNIPDFRVEVNGRDITPVLREARPGPRTADRPRTRLVSLGLIDKRGSDADQLDLVIDDSDGGVELPPTGATIRVSLGWRSGPDVTPGLVDMGTYIVDDVGHSGPPDQITIRARAADFTGAMRVRRERSWHGTTLGAIVADVAQAHGLKPRCAAALASIAVTAKAQSRESDLAFLRRLGADHDAVATIKDGNLILKPTADCATVSGTALPAVTIRRRDGDRHDYQVQKQEEATGVSADWHDRDSAKKRTVTAGKAEGARKLSRTFASEADARAAAKAEAGRTSRQPRTLSLSLALGRPDLKPETPITVSGFKAAIDAQRWVLAEVAHTLGDRGFATGLKLECAQFGSSGPSSLT